MICRKVENAKLCNTPFFPLLVYHSSLSYFLHKTTLCYLNIGLLFYVCIQLHVSRDNTENYACIIDTINYFKSNVLLTIAT